LHDTCILQVGDVALGTAQMPAEFIKTFRFAVALTSDDPRVFFGGDRPFHLLSDRPGEPVHVQGKIVHSTQEDIRRNRSGLQNAEKVLRARFHDPHIADEVEGMILGGANPVLLIFRLFSISRRSLSHS